MNQIAVTDHAVARYMERVPGADKLDKESIRVMIRERIEEALSQGTLQGHPSDLDKRLVPFTVGDQQLNFVLGPNKTTFPGQWAVIGVVYDNKDLGRVSTGATLGDVVPEELKKTIADSIARTSPKKTRFLVRIGSMKEIYDVQDFGEFLMLLERRQPMPEDVEVVERKELTLRRTYSVDQK